jgi:hypothetical protein
MAKGRHSRWVFWKCEVEVEGRREWRVAGELLPSNMDGGFAWFSTDLER